MPGFVPFCSQRRMMRSFCRFCPLVQSAKNMNKGRFVPFWHNKECASAHIRPRRASLWNGFYLILWSTACLSLIRKRRMPVGGSGWMSFSLEICPECRESGNTMLRVLMRLRRKVFQKQTFMLKTYLRAWTIALACRMSPARYALAAIDNSESQAEAWDAACLGVSA